MVTAVLSTILSYYLVKQTTDIMKQFIFLLNGVQFLIYGCSLYNMAFQTLHCKLINLTATYSQESFNNVIDCLLNI